MTNNMKDVAREAGVSIASISRVLSGSPGVGRETALRIRQVMEEMGYRPNLGARGLVKRKTGNIAVALPRGTSFILGNPFFTRVIEGIASVLDTTDYSMLLSFTSQQQKRLLENRAVDGILLFAPRTNDLSLQWVKETGSKVVLIGSYRDLPHIPSVRPDDEGGVAKAVHALYELGHRSIAFVNGPANSVKSERCLQGYKRALAELGLTWSPDHVIEAGEFDAAHAKSAVERYLSRYAVPTGVVCAADFLAMGVMKAASARGLSVPRDLSVIGFGDVPFSKYFIPSLSTVRTDLIEIGKQAASLLIDLLSDKKTRKKHRVFDMEYVARETCAPPRSE